MSAIIGVTGPSGAGKGLFCSFLSLSGCKVIDCDKLSREVCRKGSACLSELVKEYGSEILCRDGRLNRRKTAKVAFSDPVKTKRLNEITHPHITGLLKKRLFAIAKSGKVAVIDAPLLFESGLDSICDIIAFIDADRELRIERILQRDGITRDEAERRLNARKALENRANVMYYCNNGTPDELSRFAAEVLKAVNSK